MRVIFLIIYNWNPLHYITYCSLNIPLSDRSIHTRLLLLQGTDKESHYPNISKPYVRSTIDQCNYRRYSTEGWPGGTPVIELDGNHIEGVTRSKVSRSSSPAHEESLGLSRFNAANRSTGTFLLLMVSVTILVWFNRWLFSFLW